MCQHNFYVQKATLISVVFKTRTHFPEALGRPIGTQMYCDTTKNGLKIIHFYLGSVSSPLYV